MDAVGEAAAFLAGVARQEGLRLPARIRGWEVAIGGFLEEVAGLGGGVAKPVEG